MCWRVLLLGFLHQHRLPMLLVLLIKRREEMLLIGLETVLD